jgi:hypothetical protein
VNAGLLEIAEILLRFEVERIERQKTASEGIRQDNASETVENQVNPLESTRLVNSSIPRRVVKNGG